MILGHIVKVGKHGPAWLDLIYEHLPNAQASRCPFLLRKDFFVE